MKHFQFTVEGNLGFPMDMLRYDACYPFDQHSVDQISDSHEAYNWRDKATDKLRVFKVTLVSLQSPTEARWESFGWRVLNISKFMR